MKNKAIPLRRCVGCNQSKPKEELDRYVIRPMEKIFLYDESGRAPGRGAYICKGSELLDLSSYLTDLQNLHSLLMK